MQFKMTKKKQNKTLSVLKTFLGLKVLEITLLIGFIFFTFFLGKFLYLNIKDTQLGIDMGIMREKDYFGYIAFGFFGDFVFLIVAIMLIEIIKVNWKLAEGRVYKK